jgi:hypothetical protein
LPEGHHDHHRAEQLIADCIGTTLKTAFGRSFCLW